MLTRGQQIELTIEKPAAGGRMIARHEGQVILVSGAVPGERVIAQVEKTDRRLAFAAVVDVVEPSGDRRAPFSDPLCGGCVYSHVAYERQLTLKGEVIRDAFHRIGHLPLGESIDVAASPERGYRMRARLHVSRGRTGFYREGTHALCDAESTGQLAEGSMPAVRDAVALVVEAGGRPTSVEITENIPGGGRALSIVVEECTSSLRRELPRLLESGALRGVVVRDEAGRHASAGELSVSDSLATLSAGRVAEGELHRHPESFFQANRFLVPALVTAVLDEIRGEQILDLYAGVGLFSVALASTTGSSVVAVEGDRTSGADLQRNAGPYGRSITLALESVEDHLRKSRARPSTAIVDPPRTGMSVEALDALAGRASGRIVYVSCDPATMARDARKLVDAGYELSSLRAFDLFPNTPHVETLGVFEAGR